jgi:hypothetical protein
VARYFRSLYDSPDLEISELEAALEDFLEAEKLLNHQGRVNIAETYSFIAQVQLFLTFPPSLHLSLPLHYCVIALSTLSCLSSFTLSFSFLHYYSSPFSFLLHSSSFSSILLHTLLHYLLIVQTLSRLKKPDGEVFLYITMANAADPLVRKRDGEMERWRDEGQWRW